MLSVHIMDMQLEDGATVLRFMNARANKSESADVVNVCAKDAGMMMA